MKIRTATGNDAERACDVLRRSIAGLCAADHENDAATLDMWLANKTIDNVRSWASAPGQILVVAEEGGKILGVGAATVAGEITLNYVSPDARFRGVSKAVLSALEEWLRGEGCTRAWLTSTKTAHRFYRAAGYEDAGEPQAWGRLRGQPMAKAL